MLVQFRDPTSELSMCPNARTRMVLRPQNGSRCARFHAIHLVRAALVLFGDDDKDGVCRVRRITASCSKHWTLPQNVATPQPVSASSVPDD